MKRFGIFLLVAGLSISAFAQYDDIYDGSTYKSKKETKEVTTSTSTSTRSIDEYNRVGTTQTSSNVASDLDLEEDYHYTKEIVKYYDPTAVTIEDPEYVYIYNNSTTEEEKSSSSPNVLLPICIAACAKNMLSECINAFVIFFVPLYAVSVVIKSVFQLESFCHFSPE